MSNTTKKASLLITREIIEETLATKPIPGKKFLEPLKSLTTEQEVPLNILEDAQVFDNKAELHKHEHDLWYCFAGEVEFIYGGELIEPQVRQRSDGTLDENELRAKEIADGTTVTLRQGDWLWIPAGVPHQHQASGVARLAIIKIPKV